MKKGNQSYQETANKGNKPRKREFILGAVVAVLSFSAVVICAISSLKPIAPPQSDDEIVEDHIEAMKREDRDLKTEAIDVSGMYYESVVGYGDEPIEFGGFFILSMISSMLYRRLQSMIPQKIAVVMDPMKEALNLIPRTRFVSWWITNRPRM